MENRKKRMRGGEQVIHFFQQSSNLLDVTDKIRESQKRDRKMGQILYLDFSMYM